MQISAPNIDRITLGTWGDYYGYSVRPSERGKGYIKKKFTGRYK